jgi:hypothetical protein
MRRLMLNLHEYADNSNDDADDPFPVRKPERAE